MGLAFLLLITLSRAIVDAMAKTATIVLADSNSGTVRDLAENDPSVTKFIFSEIVFRVHADYK